MPTERSQNGRTSQAEQDYLEALARLESGAPTNSVLIARLAAGKLRISPSSVAKEAGRSRTPIGHAGCSLPVVRKKILLSARKHRAPIEVSLQDKLNAMNALVAELQQGIRLRDSVNAALMLEIERLKKEQKTALRRASRLGERAGVSSGQVVDFPTRSE